MHPYPHALMHVHMQMGKYTIHINTHVHTTYIYIHVGLGDLLLHSPTLTQGIAAKFLQTREGSTTCRACPSGKGHPISPKSKIVVKLYLIWISGAWIPIHRLFGIEPVDDGWSDWPPRPGRFSAPLTDDQGRSISGSCRAQGAPSNLLQWFLHKARRGILSGRCHSPSIGLFDMCIQYT